MVKEKKIKPAYAKAILVRLPLDVYQAMMKRVEHKRTKFGRYSDADFARTAIVNHLKNKGYLDKHKDYL